MPEHEHGVQEPLLPSQQQCSSAVYHVSASWEHGVRGGWMAMCGFLLDPETGSWTDGGEPRPEGASRACKRLFYDV